MKLKLLIPFFALLFAALFVYGAFADSSLDFNPENDYTAQTLEINGEKVSFRAWNEIHYVTSPVEPEYQKLNLYIPEAYFRGESINGYTAKTAPIFMPNGVGGYMPGRALPPSEDARHGTPNATFTALARGYVVATPAIRGRTLENGKAPALIVDYKAAVRWLRHNRENLPAGDVEKIISNGTSAGGALSSLLGATGNAKDYEPYLKAAGAAEERDNIFASMAYCPITNLEYADAAYEWVFNGVNNYNNSRALNPNDYPPAKPMTELQVKTSDELKKLFPSYLNSLGLKDSEGKALMLDENGDGSFKSYIESVYLASAQSALDKGEDLSGLGWLEIKDGKAVKMDLAKYAVWATRMKSAPAFDALDNSTPENNEFYDKHFTEYSFKNSTVGASMADEELIKLLNPLNYVGSADTAKHWRIRHGARDRDTSLAIPAILALSLTNAGCEVDFASPWGYGHDGDYDLKELFDWIDSICK